MNPLSSAEIADRPFWRKVISTKLIKILIAVGVIALLVHFNRIDTASLIKLSETWPWLLGAFGLMFPPFAIVSYRFKIVLLSQGIKVSLGQALRWTMIGSFFDLAMPSSNGGDIIKAGFVVKHVGAGKRTRAVMAVAFDRVLGLLGLFFLASTVCIFGWKVLHNMPERPLVLALSILASVGVLVVFRILGARRLYKNRKINLILSRHNWGLRAKQLIGSFNSLREQPIYLVTVLSLSVLNHFFWCASLLCIAKAIGHPVDPIQGFVVFPLAIFSNIFGIAGGFGLGTVGFDIMLSQLLSIENGALIGLLFQGLSACLRLTGLPFYLSTPYSKKETTYPDGNSRFGCALGKHAHKPEKSTVV